jgi:protein-tyrosine-phosphatase/O-antigen ligase
VTAEPAACPTRPGGSAWDRHGRVVLLVVFVGLVGGRFTLDRLGDQLPSWDLRWPGVLAAAALFFLWRAAACDVRSPGLTPGSGLALFAAWAGWMAFSAIWAQPGARVDGYISDLLLMITIVGLALGVTGRLSRPSLHAVWRWLVVTGLVYFAAAVLAGPGAQGRYAAFGGGPNVFVRMMVFACLGAFLLATVTRSRRVLCLVPIFLAGAVMSGSRGGLVAFVVVAVLGGIPQWRRMPRTGRRTLVAVMLVAGVGAPFLVGPQLAAELHGRFLVQTLQERYDADRGEISAAALRLFERYPVLGTGLDGYHALAGARTSFEYPHNLVLATAAEGGTIGLTLLVLALGQFARVIVAGRPLTTEALYALLGALYVLVASMFSGDYYDSRLLWFFLGLAAIEARRNGAPRRARDDRLRTVAGRRSIGARPPDEEDRREAAETLPEHRAFQILYVCTGNVCRSAFAEILTRCLLAERLGSSAAAAFRVSSAGARAVVGAGMHPDTRAELRRWASADPGADGFAARQLSAGMVEQADLVLGLDPIHRSLVVECTPAALPIGFGLREFARLAEAVDPADLPPGPMARAFELVDRARRLRGVVPPRPPAELRIPDPMGGPPEAHHATAELVADAVITIIDALAPPSAGRPRAGERSRATVGRRGP